MPQGANGKRCFGSLRRTKKLKEEPVSSLLIWHWPRNFICQLFVNLLLWNSPPNSAFGKWTPHPIPWGVSEICNRKLFFTTHLNDNVMFFHRCVRFRTSVSVFLLMDKKVLPNKASLEQTKQALIMMYIQFALWHFCAFGPWKCVHFFSNVGRSFSKTFSTCRVKISKRIFFSGSPNLISMCSFFLRLDDKNVFCKTDVKTKFMYLAFFKQSFHIFRGRKLLFQKRCTQLYHTHIYLTFYSQFSFTVQ